MAERRKKQRGLLDFVPEPSTGAVEVVPNWLDAASYDPTMLSYRAGTGLRNMLAGTAALPGLLADVARGGMQKIRELSPPELRGQSAPQSTETIDAATAMARQVAADPQAAVSQVLDYGRGILSSPGNVVEFLGENISPRPRGPRGPLVSELDVYHGSPHRFEEFDASKIGTGEGAQAYGHGIYLAESPAVGRQYAEFLASRKNDLLDPGNLAASMMYRTSAGTKEAGLREIDAALKGIKNYPNSYPDAPQQKAALEKARELLESDAELPKQGGNFYKADLPDEMVDRMLDWEASIKSQPENVKKALQPLLDKHGIARTADVGTLISAMGRDMPQSMVSEKLRELGIPGIKYLDAGSRGQGGTGTRNFVVFPGEEKKVKILSRE